jgi:hypothetical protein
VDEEVVLPPAGPEPGEGSQHIAGESRAVQVRRSVRPATSTHRIGPRTIGFRSTVAGEGTRRQTALTRRARSPLAAFCQAPLPQSTALTIGLIGQIDGPLGESMFLPHFARSAGLPLRDSVASHPPGIGEGLGPEASGSSSERRCPRPSCAGYFEYPFLHKERRAMTFRMLCKGVQETRRSGILFWYDPRDHEFVPPSRAAGQSFAFLTPSLPGLLPRPGEQHPSNQEREPE